MIGPVLAEALRLYRALWRRSMLTAGLVFAVVSLANALADESATRATTLVSLLLALVGGLLVQGALVEVVRDLVERRRAAPIAGYYERTRGRLGTLLGSALLYGVGVVVGFVLLIVPGLIAVARWSLIVPLVMIEGRGVRDAFARSSQLVTGRTGQVLAVVIVANVITSFVVVAITSAFGFLPRFGAIWLGGTLAGAIAVPYEAFVLTVLYYRLRDGEQPTEPA